MIVDQSNAGPSNQGLTAAFVRGFFCFLQEEGYAAGVLHGWNDGFEHELSDVDFVIEPRGFKLIARLLDDYCHRQKWQLCQILRHEETAAYCVCSRVDDPSCVVALDACSDYQRNGVLLLAAGDLLHGRERLPGGGERVSDLAWVKYRFAKAAAKNKPAASLEAEIKHSSPSAIVEYRFWLKVQHDIVWDDSSGNGTGDALAKLRAHIREHPSLANLGSLARIAKRLQQPSGLILVMGEKDFPASAEAYIGVFGRLYFRSVRVVPNWRADHLFAVIRSTLVILPRLPVLWRGLIPAECVYSTEFSVPDQRGFATLAEALHGRCVRRERIS